MWRRLVGWLEHPRFPWIAALVGCLLCAPALGSGLVGDDYLWWLLLQRQGPLGQGLPPLLHVYNFIPGGLEPEVLRSSGMMTWWAHPDLEIALFRPLSVATHLLDHAIAPRGFVLQHLHSLAWYAASILVVGALYRRIHPGAPAVVGLALLLFAVEDAHAMNAGWLANRHALVSMVVGLLAVLAHIAWRRRGGLPWLVAALTILSAGLCCGEGTLGAVAYLVAWQLTLDRASWPRRLAAVAPYAALIAVWRLLYDLFGYGVHGSGLYIDPGQDPLGFAMATLLRWPVLQLGQWLQLVVDAVMFVPPPVFHAVFGVSVLVCGALGWFLAPLLRRSAEARFWALGMSLSLVPLCAAFPMDRLLAFAGIGAFALLAMQVQRLGWLTRDERPAAPRLHRWVTAGLLLLHLPVAALFLLGRTGTLVTFNQIFTAGAYTAPEDPEVTGQSFLFVSGHEFPVAYTSIVRWVEERPAPGRTALLASFVSDNRVERLDEYTLLIEPDRGFLADGADRLERSLDPPFTAGERYEMPDFTAEVRTVTGDGRPRSVAFRFRQPLEDESYRWLQWGLNGAEPFELPAVGEEVVVRTVPLTAAFPQLD